MFSKKFGVVLCILIACLSSRAEVTSKDYEYVISFVRELIQKGVTNFDDIRNELGDKIKDFESVYLDMLENEFSFYTKLKSEDTPGESGGSMRLFDDLLSEADSMIRFHMVSGETTVENLLASLKYRDTDLNEYQKKELVEYLQHLVDGDNPREGYRFYAELMLEAYHLFGEGTTNVENLLAKLEDLHGDLKEYQKEVLVKYLENLVDGENSGVTVESFDNILSRADYVNQWQPVEQLFDKLYYDMMDSNEYQMKVLMRYLDHLLDKDASAPEVMMESIDKVLFEADKLFHGSRTCVGYLWDKVKNQTEGFDENQKKVLVRYLEHLVDGKAPHDAEMTDVNYQYAVKKLENIFDMGRRTFRTAFMHPYLIRNNYGYDDLHKLEDLFLNMTEYRGGERRGVTMEYFNDVLSGADRLSQNGTTTVEDLLTQLHFDRMDLNEYQKGELMMYLQYLVDGENPRVKLLDFSEMLSMAEHLGPFNTADDMWHSIYDQITDLNEYETGEFRRYLEYLVRARKFPNDHGEY